MKKQVFTKQWLKAAGIRSLKTFMQSIASLVTVGIMITDVDWKYVLSVSAMSAVYSIVTSFAGLPELNEGDVDTIDEQV